MRDLISRKALLDTLCNECGDYGRCKYPCINYDMIALAPAIDAEPVQRGKWMATGEYDEWYAEECKCSICGGIVLGNEDNFCLHCGAKMD